VPAPLVLELPPEADPPLLVLELPELPELPLLPAPEPPLMPEALAPELPLMLEPLDPELPLMPELPLEPEVPLMPELELPPLLDAELCLLFFFFDLLLVPLLPLLDDEEPEPVAPLLELPLLPLVAEDPPVPPEPVDEDVPCAFTATTATPSDSAMTICFIRRLPTTNSSEMVIGSRRSSTTHARGHAHCRHRQRCPHSQRHGSCTANSTGPNRRICRVLNRPGAYPAWSCRRRLECLR